ncbi:hypothetical protein MMC25_002720 [Agyrium rufum]|nr:hypothetical protein [Agyrium rufum]
MNFPHLSLIFAGWSGKLFEDEEGFEEAWYEKAQRIIRGVKKKFDDAPTTTKVGIALICLSVTILPTLFLVGFGTAGPVAGSLAASWQSSIGLVQAGSLFAFLQSAVMGGGAATFAGWMAGAGGLTIMLPHLKGWSEKMRDMFQGLAQRLNSAAGEGLLGRHLRTATEFMRQGGLVPVFQNMLRKAPEDSRALLNDRSD